MVRVGAGVVDITPPAGLAMTGFGARTEPATGAHDRLTARALVIGDTAVVVADVLGIDAAMSARIRARSGLDERAVVVAAVHNHGGPVSMAGRLGAEAEPNFLQMLEDGCVEALRMARETACECSLHFGYGAEPGIGKNRRHADGPIDRKLPVLIARNAGGEALAVLTSYACHPVVLDATNLLWTADYPHFLRAEVEGYFPGAVAVFLTGCAGDINTGHTAQASMSLAANPARTYTEAERIGRAIARSVCEAVVEPVMVEKTAFAEAMTLLDFERREAESLPELVRQWSMAADEAEGPQKVIFRAWAAWAHRFAEDPLLPLQARVSAMRWGGVGLAALPGEIFSQTALDIRTLMGLPGFVICYADDNPGYIPPAPEYAHGGYEVDEAHRYYGLPASFAKGSAERLVEAAAHALEQAGKGAKTA
ncbi:MAG TPA: neutral/alkaline non-lysosomal ceramidase N-terminal domain-containing protein [Pelagibacterium sp.]|uniref:neutral/alkaline non-lysosomal ceramidase N-terminal domain-containing protein n=1 Tax=Pelagibacterium sp. TaxID=1967288 RepID=UPI002C7E29BB|nr:neutral/alkaline non-lysosomal ceramidase N-terminal domain-containing protein [Pelagibacterium sp.]HWJ87980.1 neutral/alkaline non-lysosomal ceramidase N-terminal domain-containing protein [Pelagibacterium sp.]